MGANLKYREEPLTFRRKQTHDLNKFLRSLTKESENVVETLVELLKHTDPKIRLTAASKLGDFLTTVAEIVDKDNLQRLLLESKNPERGRNLALEDDDTPQINFDQIQDI